VLAACGVAALLLLAGAAYAPALGAGFFWDDVSIYLLENPLIHAADGLRRFWFTTQPVDYYPVTNTLLWIEWRLWGEHAAGYHAVNLFLHGLGVLILWGVLRALAVPGAWLAAACFAVHPVNVETVAWISQTKNTLSLALSLAALRAWLRFDADRGRGALAASFGLYVLAVLAKTSAAVFPLVAFGAAAWRRRRIAWDDVRPLLPFLAAGAVLGAVGAWFQGRTPGAVEFAAEPLATRLAAAGSIVWFYLGKALMPVGLMPVYPRWPVDPSRAAAWLPNVLLLAVLGVAWRSWHRGGCALLAGLGYYLLNLVPVLGFAGVGFMAHARVTDHWQYAALPGVVALLAAGGVRLWARLRLPRRVGVGVAALALGVAGVLAWRQTALYVDEEKLWRDNLRKNPHAWVAHNNLGNLLAQRGRLAEAQASLQAALGLAPNYADALVNLANVLDDRGRTAEAVPYYERALRVAPPSANVHYNYGVALEKSGRDTEAAAQYERALALAPEDAAAHHRLCEVWARLGRDRDAAPHCRAAMRLDPRLAAAATRLVWLLAASRDPGVADARQAVQVATRLCEATGWSDAAAVDALAVAYAATGRMGDAAETARRALARAQATGATALARDIEARLQWYAGQR
jgi:tetratricopeptide (TPR) repeat protein